MSGGNVVPLRPGLSVPARVDVIPKRISEYTDMHEAFDIFQAYYIAWLRQAKPRRDDAELEAEGFGSVLRQLATLNTTQGASGK